MRIYSNVVPLDRFINPALARVSTEELHRQLETARERLALASETTKRVRQERDEAAARLAQLERELGKESLVEGFARRSKCKLEIEISARQPMRLVRA